MFCPTYKTSGAMPEVLHDSAPSSSRVGCAHLLTPAEDAAPSLLRPPRAPAPLPPRPAAPSRIMPPPPPREPRPPPPRVRGPPRAASFVSVPVRPPPLEPRPRLRPRPPRPRACKADTEMSGEYSMGTRCGFQKHPCISQDATSPGMSEPCFFMLSLSGSARQGVPGKHDEMPHQRDDSTVRLLNCAGGC